MRQTVVDYVACSKTSYDNIVAFEVNDRVQGYDHASTTLRIKLDFDTQNMMFASPRKKRKADITLPDASVLTGYLSRPWKVGRITTKRS
jgi:hypothetical protein